MKNYVCEGKTIEWTNTTNANVASGQVVVVGHMLAVACEPIADDETGMVAIEGVFSGVPKVSAAVFVKGEKLVFDVSAGSGVGAFDDSAATPASGDITGGAVAWAAGGNGETTCTIKLTPGNTTLTA